MTFFYDLLYIALRISKREHYQFYLQPIVYQFHYNMLSTGSWYFLVMFIDKCAKLILNCISEARWAPWQGLERQCGCDGRIAGGSLLTDGSFYYGLYFQAHLHVW